MNKILIIVLLIVVIAGVAWSVFWGNKEPLVINSFEDCAKAGLPVMESYPRQCKTEDGRTFAEEIPEKITYDNSTDDLIKVDLPYPGAVVGKLFKVIGQARGYWFFEASFPVKILDIDGNMLTSSIAQAKDEWMTEEFVPFEADVAIPPTYIGPATLVLIRDNPSGLPQNDASISFPITIEY